MTERTSAAEDFWTIVLVSSAGVYPSALKFSASFFHEVVNISARTGGITMNLWLVPEAGGTGVSVDALTFRCVRLLSGNLCPRNSDEPRRGAAREITK